MNAIRKVTLTGVLTIITILQGKGGTFNQGNTEWPWTQALIGHSSFHGKYPTDSRPDLAMIVMHDDEIYHPPEWAWNHDEWVMTLPSTSGDPSNNNVEITKSCKEEQSDCWFNLTMVHPFYVVCQWTSKLTQPTLLGLIQKIKMNVVARPKQKSSQINTPMPPTNE